MQDKTKKKIEAMAEKIEPIRNEWGTVLVSGVDRRTGFREGATPFAIWAERLANSLDQVLTGFVHEVDINKDTEDWFNTHNLLLKSYRSWLEEQ